MPEVKKQEKVGGLTFYSALLALAILDTLTLGITLANLGAYEFRRCLVFFVSVPFGFVAGSLFLHGRFGVFLHELKHSIVSNLSGNRAKKMKVGSKEGYFSYEYTKRTAHMNAFINIAPYVFPLFTVVLLGLGAVWLTAASKALVVLAGLGFGMDTYAHLRDAGPHQTDFTVLRGGYSVGISFVLLANAAVLMILMFWVGAGGEGLFLWLDELLRIAHSFVQIFTGHGTE